MNSLEEPTIGAQLAQLREFTARYGVLHEAHLLQLKIWPRVLLPASISSEGTVNLEKKNVDIFVKFKGKLPPKKELDAGVTRLLKSVQWMLGPEWGVQVRGGFWKDVSVKLGEIEPQPEQENDVMTPPRRWARPRE